MTKIFKSTVLYTVANILPQAVAFILLPIYTKYLLPEEYGIVNAMVVVQAILAIFFSLSLERSLIRMYWDYQDRRNDFFGTLTISVAIISILTLITTFVLKDFLILFFAEIDFYPFYFFTILTIFVQTFFLIPKNIIRLENNAKLYLILSFIELLITTLLTIYYLVYRLEGAEGIIKAKLFSTVILLPYFIFFVVKNIKLSFDFSILKKCLWFSLPIIPSMFAAWILGQADRVFIADYLSMHDLGIYSLSRRLAGLIGIISGAFAMAYHPLFFELVNSDNQDLKKLKKINDAFIYVVIFLGFAVSLFSKDLVVLFLNQKYHESYIYIPPIVLTTCIGSISSTVIGAFIQQSKKMKSDMYFGFLGAALTVLFYLFFINKIGAWGAILGNLIATTVIFILLYFYAKKKCFFISFNWRKIVILTVLSISLVLLINYYFNIQPLFAIILKFVVISISLLFLIYDQKLIIFNFKLFGKT